MTSGNERGTIMSHRYWAADECLRVTTSEPKSACDSGNCLHVDIVGDHVRLWETASPDQVVVTTLASWQQVQGKARAEERAAIVAFLREVEASHESFGLADLVERGLFADVAAGDE